MQPRDLPVEQFPALGAIAGLRHGFTTRAVGIDLVHDKAEMLSRLDAVHGEIREGCGVGDLPFITAEQVHGNGIGVVDQPITSGTCFRSCDGLVTNRRDICLGIYVADCCAVYLVDPIRHVIGLVHSGRKGTELAIVTVAIREMTNRFGAKPEDIVAQLSPCIRPPRYEIDFAAEIVRQCREAGVNNVSDSGACTACDLKRYYSYRAEKGRTGRMLALLAMVGKG